MLLHFATFMHTLIPLFAPCRVTHLTKQSQLRNASHIWSHSRPTSKPVSCFLREPTSDKVISIGDRMYLYFTLVITVNHSPIVLSTYFNFVPSSCIQVLNNCDNILYFLNIIHRSKKY